MCSNALQPATEEKKEDTLPDIHTVRLPINVPITLNDDISIKSSSNLKSNDIFGKLIQFCVQKCPWMLILMKN